MEALWFGIAAVMVAIYVVMDGFDFGAGALYPWVARKDGERRQVLGAIGPFWDGNEVWLLALGGVLFLAFPKILAAGLSGFYLAIMMVLWVLILRGISIEYRSHLKDRMWRGFWDFVFAFASTLAPVLFGAALGNLIRGVPLNGEGWFGLALFDSFSPYGAPGILDWFTVLTGLLALAATVHHGALFLVWKTEGPVRERSLAAAKFVFPVLVVLWLLATIFSAQLAPWLFENLKSRPLAWISTVLFLGGLATSFIARRHGKELLAFLGSGAFMLGNLAAIAACAYPMMLRSLDDPDKLSLTAQNTASNPESLKIAIHWWPVGFALAILYIAVLMRLHRGKVKPLADEDEGY